MSHKKKIVVSVSSDLSTDQRVQKVCNTLATNNFEVLVLGRKLPQSPKFGSLNYSYKRFSLWFNKGALFYANLNIRLFFKLLFTKAAVFYANDLDTLPANYLASKIKGVPMIYDSHEYFTEVPELVNRPSVQRIWHRIEGTIVPKLQHCITVTFQISETYKKLYNVDFKVMRNFPIYIGHRIPEKENAILYQGALNVGRGLEELIAAMPDVRAELWIAGGGDIEQEIKVLVNDLGLQNKIHFLGRLEPLQLKEYTLRAKIGVSLEHKLGLNYTYALPNKIFDYLHCQTPILYADLVEVKKALNGIEVGEELRSYENEILANQLNEMLNSSKYALWQSNCKELSQKLTWQDEEKVLLNILKEV
ncbi:glycosyltransferase [Vicingaceae bacterium]|nr:glycosyltransferase [Vicingaceae bacterium]